MKKNKFKQEDMFIKSDLRKILDSLVSAIMFEEEGKGTIKWSKAYPEDFNQAEKRILDLIRSNDV